MPLWEYPLIAAGIVVAVVVVLALLRPFRVDVTIHHKKEDDNDSTDGR